MLESESHSVMSDSSQPHGLYSQWNFPSQNTGVDSLSLFQGIFPTQRSNPGLLALQADSLPTELPFSSAQFRCSVVSNSLWTHELQHNRLPYPSPFPVPCSNSCPLSRLSHPTVSSSVIPFSSCLQSFPASGSFPMSQFFAVGDQSIGASDPASVLSMNIQDWFHLGLTSSISLKSKRLSRVFSNTTAQKHQFFSAQLSLWSNSRIIHDYWKNHSFD